MVLFTTKMVQARKVTKVKEEKFGVWTVLQIIYESRIQLLGELRICPIPTGWRGTLELNKSSLSLHGVWSIPSKMMNLREVSDLESAPEIPTRCQSEWLNSTLTPFKHVKVRNSASLTLLTALLEMWATSSGLVDAFPAHPMPSSSSEGAKLSSTCPVRIHVNGGTIHRVHRVSKSASGFTKPCLGFLLVSATVHPRPSDWLRQPSAWAEALTSALRVENDPCIPTIQ